MKHKILLVEDSKEVYQLVLQALSGPLIEVEWVTNISDAESALESEEYNLLLLDIELPDGNGLELCQKVQANWSKLPVFILTGKDSLSEKVMGFSVGADDYITKPFNGIELKARVEAKLKKVEVMSTSNDILKWNEIEINKVSQEVFVKNKEDSKELELVELTALEFKILMYFSSREGEVLERDVILNEIWGEDVHVYSRSVDTHVSKLRKKLQCSSEIIESVHGVGYKFCPTS